MFAHIDIGNPTVVFSKNEYDFNMPSISLLSNGDILCLARKINGLNDSKGELVMARSYDGGKTFIEVQHPNTADAKAHPEWGFLLGFVCEAAPGKLVSIYEYIETDDSKPLFSPNTDGMQQAYIRCTVSNDNGLTWEPACDIGFELPDIIVPGQPYVLPNGSIGFATEIHDVWENGYVDGPSSWFIVSRDGGCTFSEGYLMAAENGIIHGDARITFDEDKIITYFWCHDTINNCDLPVHICSSCDSGHTWSKPLPIELNMQITNPHFVKKGATMCLTQDRFGESPGLKAMLSYDEGQTWDTSSAVYLYGTSSRPDGTNPFAQFDQFKFGGSTLCKISNNEVICAYWHEHSGKKAVSVNKIRVEY